MNCDTVKEDNIFLSFPSDAMLEIFSNLSADQLARMREVCRRWKSLAEENSCWRKHLKEIGFAEDKSTKEVPLNHEIYREIRRNNLPCKFEEVSHSTNYCSPLSFKYGLFKDYYNDLISYACVFGKPTIRVRIADGKLHIVKFNMVGRSGEWGLEATLDFESLETSTEKKEFDETFRKRLGIDKYWDGSEWINQRRNISSWYNPDSRWKVTHDGRTYEGGIYHRQGNKLAIVQGRKINVINLETNEVEFTLPMPLISFEDCKEYSGNMQPTVILRSIHNADPTSIFMFNKNILFLGTLSGWIIGWDIKRNKRIFCDSILP